MKNTQVYRNILRAILVHVIAFTYFITTNAEVHTYSSDIEILVNDSIRFNCNLNTSINNIHWYQNEEFVATGENVYSPYDTRFTVDNNTSSLSIENVLPEDKGSYSCTDLEGKLKDRPINLIVLDSSPTCSSNMMLDGFVGSNTCNLTQDEMTFSCSVSFHGDIPPQLKWRLLDHSQVFDDSRCRNDNNRINCTVVLKADPKYNGSKFTCQTTKAPETQYLCSTTTIKVQYFLLENNSLTQKNMTIGQKANCSFRTSQFAHMNWKRLHDGQPKIISNNPSIVFEEPGLHQCEVDYYIQSLSCSSLVSFVYVQDDGSSKSSNIGLIVGVIVGVITGLILLALLAFALRKRKGAKSSGNVNFQPSDNDNTEPLLPEPAIVRTHVTLEGENLDHKEKHIVSQLTNILTSNGLTPDNIADAILMLLDRHQITIKEVKQGNSIVFCISCAGMNELNHLRQIVDNGTMKNVLEEVFNHLCQNMETKILTVNLMESDAENAEKLYRQAFQDAVPASSTSEDDVHDATELTISIESTAANGIAGLPGAISPGSTEATPGAAASGSGGNSISSPSGPMDREDNKPNPPLSKNPAETVRSTETFPIGDNNDNWNEIIRTNYCDLIRMLVCDAALEGEFKKLGQWFCTSMQIKTIWGRQSSLDKTKCLLDWLERGDKQRFAMVKAALVNAGQRSIVAMHLSRVKEHVSQKLPNKYCDNLKEPYRCLLQKHWNQLIENINCGEAIYFLKETGFLTPYQEAELRDMGGQGVDQIQYFLRVLEKGSQQHYDEFCEYLCKSNQSHIVNEYLTPLS